MDKSKNILSLEDFSIQDKRKGNKIIELVNLELKEGDRIGIIGPSGAGKSMTVTSALGIQPIDGINISGKVRLLDKVDYLNCDIRVKREVLKKMIGYMPQDTNNVLNPYLGVLSQFAKEISFVLGLDSKQARVLATEWMKRVGINGDEKTLNLLPEHFSGGMKQRVVFAMAIYKNPRLLIVDEPASALDLINQQIAYELLLKHLDNSLTSMIYISHSPAMVKKLCNKVAVFNRGSLVEFGEVEDVFCNPKNGVTKNILEACYYMNL